MDTATVRLKELEVRVKELELASELARIGLKSGATGVGLVFLTVLGTFGVALYSYVITREPIVSGGQMIWRDSLITGTNLVLLTLILVAGLVLYFAFVFRRDAQVVAKLAGQELIATTSVPPPGR